MPGHWRFVLLSVGVPSYVRLWAALFY